MQRLSEEKYISREKLIHYQITCKLWYIAYVLRLFFFVARCERSCLLNSKQDKVVQGKLPFCHSKHRRFPYALQTVKKDRKYQSFDFISRCFWRQFTLFQKHRIYLELCVKECCKLIRLCNRWKQLLQMLFPN